VKRYHPGDEVQLLIAFRGVRVVAMLLVVSASSAWEAFEGPGAEV
jgi:hypothetical protein